MSNANASLCRDHLLRDSCSWQARTGGSESGGDVAETFATAVTLKCNVAQPSSRWITAYPNIDLTESREFWLPGASTVARRDKLTYDGIVFRVQERASWAGAGVIVVATSHTGIT